MRYTYFLTKTKQMEYADIHIDDIILRLFNGTASPDDIATLSRWMEQDAANRQYFEQQQREWNADGGGDIASTFDYEAAFGRFERHIAQDKNAPTADEYDADETTPHRLWSINHPWLRLQLRVVASVAAVALIVIGTWLSYNRYTKQYAERFANMVNVEAPAGSRAKVMLPDGTAVWLNAGSQLSYSQGFGITDRNVRINGEGYFEVGKGSDMPMSVCSSNMCVRDIGTKFNFRDYPEEPTAEVTLCEGEVGVTSVKFPKHEVVIHPEQMTLLDKRTGRITATSCYSADKRLWTSGELVMDEMTIHQIITAIERAYKVSIVIESERVKHLQLCGTLNLDRENLDEILQVIATAGSISYKVKNKTVYLK